ncbi:beta-glucosidase [Sphingomonadales bacterium 56]|uniref:glycoside hydrolase family 3 N-terminal domain-containing protein n=1 Tax=unclassified Sphingobium TaxID=2611147 RepID=UPI00191A2C57|nr:beta-glucosidase [Sphingomonadales bacterium 56]MBY2960394.1 beta-glucosidase [Sphingomonadales bacterium 58]CAD7341022.1 Beta-xylosidase [Sphingobium sp. S8]CAD7342184.1 Beta-xylosidase [Sphingobium sp. S6]
MLHEADVTRRSLLISSACLFAWQASGIPAAMAAVRRPLSSRVKSLIAQMTIEEKAGQLTLMPTPWTSAAAAKINPEAALRNIENLTGDAQAGRLGGVFNGFGVEAHRKLQTAAMKGRLGIPMIFAGDVIHGYRTVFPVPLGEAASFDPDLAERTARAAAEEMAATGFDWVFAPMVDIGRDARWGRTVEGAGEDVLLSSDMARARTRGFQGRSLADDASVAACMKHFVAYGAAESGLDYNTADISERTLREVYLPPFQAAVDAGCATVMAAFEDIAGRPIHGGREFLTDILRGEMGFDGLVVGDYNGDVEIAARGLAADARDAARIAIMAGLDMSMASGIYRDHLPSLVQAGEVPMERVDEAVGRVLALKERLGLFEDPFRRMDLKRQKARMRTKPALSLAREAAQRSIVMLKNDGNLLPLPREGKRIAIIGPFAEGPSNLHGPWTLFADNKEAVDLASAVRAAVSDASLISVVKGSEITAPIEGGIDAAVAAARSADIVILAVGEREAMSGEAASRDLIVVPAPQQALAEAVAAVGKPMIVALRNGRALALEGAILNAPAILVTWFLGSEMGNAVADILFGATGPSGRLPVSFPISAGQVPYYYAHRRPGRPANARYITSRYDARFPFGHGLTYGEISYADLAMSSKQIPKDGSLRVTVTVKNDGKYAARELVQLYVQDVVASVTQPIRELKAYKHVDLPPNRSQQVTFDLAAADLAFLGVDLKPVVEIGKFKLWVAPSAEAESLAGEFEVS